MGASLEGGGGRSRSYRHSLKSARTLPRPPRLLHRCDPRSRCRVRVTVVTRAPYHDSDAWDLRRAKARDLLEVSNDDLNQLSELIVLVVGGASFPRVPCTPKRHPDAWMLEHPAYCEGKHARVVTVACVSIHEVDGLEVLVESWRRE